MLVVVVGVVVCGRCGGKPLSKADTRTHMHMHMHMHMHTHVMFMYMGFMV